MRDSFPFLHPVKGKATSYSYPLSALSLVDVCALFQTALCELLLPAMVQMVFVSVPGWHTTILLSTILLVTKGTALSSSLNDFSSVTPFVPCFYGYDLCAVVRL